MAGYYLVFKCLYRDEDEGLNFNVSKECVENSEQLRFENKRY